MCLTTWPFSEIGNNANDSLFFLWCPRKAWKPPCQYLTLPLSAIDNSIIRTNGFFTFLYFLIFRSFLSFFSFILFYRTFLSSLFFVPLFRSLLHISISSDFLLSSYISYICRSLGITERSLPSLLEAKRDVRRLQIRPCGRGCQNTFDWL